MTGSRHQVTVTFSEQEWYVLSRLLAGSGEEAEQYIHDAIVQLFASDIDLVFRPGTPSHDELKMCIRALQLMALPAIGR